MQYENLVNNNDPQKDQNSKIIPIKRRRQTEGLIFQDVNSDIQDYVSTEDDLDFETHRWFNYLMLPICALMMVEAAIRTFVYARLLRIQDYRTAMTWSSFLFDYFSQSLRFVRWGAANFRSLDIIYNFFGSFGIIPEKERRMVVTDNLWFRTLNAQAVRNRLKLAVKLEYDAIKPFLHLEKINILSIASGSAQSILLLLSRLKHEGYDIGRVKVRLIDLDADALYYSRRLAERFGMANLFEYRQGSTTDLEKLTEDFSPHMVEMIGFLDYRNDDQAIHLLKRIKAILVANGTLLTCNIRPNVEMWFLKYVIQWSMNYRTVRVMKKVIKGAGFEPSRSAVISEPLGVHSIMWCQ